VKNFIRKNRIVIQVILEVFIIVMLAFMLFWPFRVVGQSMQPNFRHRGTVAASRMLVWAGRIDRGHIIICRIYHYNVRYTAIKRVVGLPGEHVVIYNGRVYINGVVLEHDHETPGAVDVLLGNNEFFILGDDRTMSYDSRMFGVVRHGDIVARVLFSRSF